MIQANELRIGNLVQANSEHRHRHTQYGRVTAIYGSDAKEERFTVDYHHPGTWFEPVKLSPEILEACGFIKETGDYFKDSVVYSNKIRLYQHDNNDYSLYGFNECKVWVFYLHELQNLFAILTGTELSINLEKVKA